MQNRTFLCGLIVGLALGVSATWLSSQIRGMATPTAPAPRPPQYVIVDDPQAVPNAWQRHKFNGRTFYFIPLASARS